MDNHGNRPEVKQALKTGSGSAIRESGTLEKNTYYYAEKMNDGQIIRVAKEAGNLWQFGTPDIPNLFGSSYFGNWSKSCCGKTFGKKSYKANRAYGTTS